jgi:galactokinase/mevalonate kinase-like predicted kinase
MSSLWDVSSTAAAAGATAAGEVTGVFATGFLLLLAHPEKSSSTASASANRIPFGNNKPQFKLVLFFMENLLISYE